MSTTNSTNNIFLQQKVVNSATNYTVLDDDVIINITDTSSRRIVTLPAPSSTNIGKFFIVKDASGVASRNTIVVSSSFGNIDGATNYILRSNYESVIFYSDGSNYFIQSEKNPQAKTVQAYDTVSVTHPVGTVIFDKSIGTIPYSNATGLFTLSVGKIYKLSVAYRNTGTGKNIDVKWKTQADLDLLPNIVQSSGLGVADCGITELLYSPYSTTNNIIKVTCSGIISGFVSGFGSFASANIIEIN